MWLGLGFRPRISLMAEHENAAAPTNHFLWLGPVIAVPGMLSYFVFFNQWPALRDTAWLNILILAAALLISVLGLRRAAATGGWRVFAGIASTLVSGASGAALLFYVFSLSNQLPSAEGVTAEGERVPAVTLFSYDGKQIDVAAQKSMILVFYRGFW